MDSALKAKWVEALRSGKYRQGRQALRTGDEFCCLGVLCDVGGLGEWHRNVDDETGEPYDWQTMVFVSGERDSDMLPRNVRDKLGLSPEAHEKCWKMNDNDKKSFSEIADWIEANL